MTTNLPTHKFGTREEWLTARLRLLEAEKELTRRSDELARQRQELPWVRLDKKYRFDTDEGSASLKDLSHYRAGCPSCSAIADGFSRQTPEGPMPKWPPASE